LFITWKDNILVLFMTIIIRQLEIINKLYKKFSEISISAKTISKFFGNKSRKFLLVPVFDNKYNNKINPVDQGN
jgi:hypothetical protein